MKELFLVARYTFKDLVKRKSFIISNIIILLIIVLGFNIPNIIDLVTGEDENFGKKQIVILDVDDAFEGNLSQLQDADLDYTIQIAEEGDTRETLEEKIKNEEIESALIISSSEYQLTFNYVVKSIGTYDTTPDNLIEMLEAMYKNLQISKLNATPEQFAKINMPMNVEMSQVDSEEASGNVLAMMLMSIVLFYAIYFYAYQVSSSITTEKTSKIIETLVTSTSPKTIVLGKTLGIGFAGLMQTAMVVIVAVICANAFLTQEIVSSVLDLSNITPMLAIVIFVYYILGYALYAMLYALTGSTVSKPEDIQSANGPVAILAVVGFYLSYFTMMNPTSSLNSIAAIFPISSPFCMPFRVMMGLTNVGDVLVSVAVLLITIVIIAKVSIKIYSSAILNYGSKINFKDLIKIYKNKND